MEKLIVNNVSIESILKSSYDNSKPQGMGFMQYEEGTLGKSELKRLCTMIKFNDSWHFDYIKGRAIKLTVKELSETSFELSIYKDGDKFSWFDHSHEDVLGFLENLKK